MLRRKFFVKSKIFYHSRWKLVPGAWDYFIRTSKFELCIFVAQGSAKLGKVNFGGLKKKSNILGFSKFTHVDETLEDFLGPSTLSFHLFLAPRATQIEVHSWMLLRLVKILDGEVEAVMNDWILENSYFKKIAFGSVWINLNHSMY